MLSGKRKGGPTKGRVKSMQFASFVRRIVAGVDGRTNDDDDEPAISCFKNSHSKTPVSTRECQNSIWGAFCWCGSWRGFSWYEMEFDTQTIELTTIFASLHRFCREWFWSRLVLIELNSTGIYNLIIVIVSLFEWLEEGLRFLFRLWSMVIRELIEFKTGSFSTFCTNGLTGLRLQSFPELENFNLLVMKFNDNFLQAFRTPQSVIVSRELRTLRTGSPPPYQF